MNKTIKAEESKYAIRDEFQQHLASSCIMMVDDDPITMETVRTFLEGVGYNKFILVEHPTHAIKKIEEANPDILLLDLVMPEMSGFEVLSAIRAHPKFRHLPVIILTSSGDTMTKLKALDFGATDFLSKPVDPSELILRVRNTLTSKAYLDQMKYYDTVTKLPNKSMFLEHFKQALENAKRHGNHMALLNIELDNFDRINDTIGLNAGDEVLRMIASRIKHVTRSIDTLVHIGPSEYSGINLYRLEASVFLLILNLIHTPEDAATVANRLIDIIKVPFNFEDKEIYAAASIGIAIYPPESENPTSLMRLASSAKNYVKNRGGNSFQFSSPSINEIYEKRHILDAMLRKALEKEEFMLYYQPKVDIKTNTIQGVEALLRMKNGNTGFVSTQEIIALAEDTGFIIPIGEWVLHEACTQLKKWHQTGNTPISMSVNLSVKQFTDPELFAMLKRTIDNSGIDPRFLSLELTESLLLEDTENKIELLKYLSTMGVKLSLDDFGTGYSSLTYLNKLPVDELKIDRSFIKDMVDNKNNRTIVESVIFLAHRLGMITVAEGVETTEQLRLLQKERCDQYQGYLFSRPLPSGELLKLLPSRS